MNNSLSPIRIMDVQSVDELVRLRAAEKKVINYLAKLTGIGAGEDPIGFLIASHNALKIDNEGLRDSITVLLENKERRLMEYDSY